MKSQSEDVACQHLRDVGPGCGRPGRSGCQMYENQNRCYRAGCWYFVKNECDGSLKYYLIDSLHNICLQNDELLLHITCKHKMEGAFSGAIC